MATGAPGTNGVWQYGEDDSEATFSALLNKVASTTDTQIGTDRGRLTTLEARKLSGLTPIIPSSVDKSGGTASYNSTTGLVTFTGVSSVSLNSVFTSTYKNYLAIGNVYGSSSGAELRSRYRTSGVDNSSNVYTFIRTSQYGNSGGTGTGTERLWFGNYNLLGYLTVDVGVNETTIVNPQNTSKTGSYTAFSSFDGNAQLGGAIQASINATTQFDGITLYPATGTLSGFYQLYGWN